MDIVNLNEFEQSFVIHFGGEFKRINAYTLASTLVSIADAAKAANSLVNPGYEIEVVVEALGDGSFKAKIRTIYQSAQNIFSAQDVKTIVLNLIASFIFLHTLAPDSSVNITLNGDLVIIEHENTKVIVPREVHDILRDVEHIPQFRKSISKVFDTIENDEQIKSIGISKNINDEKPEFEIPRERFPLMSTEAINDESGTRAISEITELQIIRAILEKSRRMWEFSWKGIRISAPVTDNHFYDEFSAHRITIAPGDSLQVQLIIYQRRDPINGIYINERYEIAEVLNHIPRMWQSDMATKEQN